eukprot:s1449_g5.t3
MGSTGHGILVSQEELSWGQRIEALLQQFRSSAGVVSVDNDFLANAMPEALAAYESDLLQQIAVAPSGEIEAREDTAAPVPEGSAAPEDQQDDEAEDPEIAPKPGKRRRMKTRRELLRDAAKARLRRMVAPKKKRGDLEVPGFVVEEWNKGMEHAFCSAPDPVSSRSASPACEHIRGIVLEDSEIRGIIEEIDDHPDIQWRLPKRVSTAGAVLQHSILAVRGLINAEGPLSFKVGITHNAVWRWENQLYGHKQDKRYKWQAMLILHLAEEPYSICMLEAALINHFKGVMAPRSSTAALAVAAGAAGAASMAFVAAAPSSAGAARQSRVQGASAPTSGAASSIAPIVGTAALATGATVLAQLSTSRRQARVAMGSGLMSPGYNTLPEREKPKSGFEGLNGDQAPLGFWDPLGLSKDQDVEVFKRRRETEIKHGRVAMFATIGYIVPEYYKFPGLLSPSQGLKFADVPNGLKALSVVPKEGWAQILAFAGFIELVVNKKTSEPGNYGKGFLGLGAVGFGSSINDPTLRAKKLSAEIANGRLAMMAIIGMFFQDGLTGSAWGDWALYTDSPIRAFEDETGVQAPVGFWDPLGLSASGNVSDFKRRREVELKHGRVAMFATIGYILPEYWRFPGYLSKYLDIKFADVPNGLSAFSKVPAFGWLQIVGFAGIVEIQIYNEQIKDEPGNYGAGFLGLRSIGIMNTGIEDPEVRKKKLNAELANGRLAMMAIIGMFFQDGLTGSAWGDWANYTASPLRAFEEELGVQAPVGFWDPVGYTRDGSVETFKRRRETEIKHGRVAMYATIGYIVPEYFKWPGFLSPSLGLKLGSKKRRAVGSELGLRTVRRLLVCLHESEGWSVDDGKNRTVAIPPGRTRKFSDVPNGLAAISKVPGAGWAQIVAFAGYYELFVYKFKGDPGAYGWKAITSADPEGLKKKLNAEIANGRLAMMAIIGMFFQDLQHKGFELASAGSRNSKMTGSVDGIKEDASAARDGLTGSAWGDWANYTDSPLRAFEEELGVQAPVGFWDPVGYTRDGSVETFKRRRETEIKHGRVAMYATVGYIVPEYFKWPGFLSPSLGLKFSDVPNGLAAISKVPGAGWAQIVAFAGYYELFVYKFEGEPGAYGWKAITSPDPEGRTKKLNAELANGRLATGLEVLAEE